MKFFYDTEFWERGTAAPIMPISIGMVAEDGRELYLEILFDWNKCDHRWLHEHVKPHLWTLRPSGVSGYDRLGAPVQPRQAALTIQEFADTFYRPELWGYYADYDHVVLCQLFGAMVALPKGWPMYTMDVKQWCVALGNPTLPKQEGTEHNALDDARWTRKAWEFLRNYEKEQKARAALIHAGELNQE